MLLVQTAGGWPISFKKREAAVSDFTLSGILAFLRGGIEGTSSHGPSVIAFGSGLTSAFGLALAAFGSGFTGGLALAAFGSGFTGGEAVPAGVAAAGRLIRLGGGAVSAGVAAAGRFAARRPRKPETSKHELRSHRPGVQFTTSHPRSFWAPVHDHPN